MAVSLEQFLKQLEDTGILGGETLQDFRPPKSTLEHAEELSLELVRHKKLTRFQAERIYLGQAESLLLGNYLLIDKIGTGGMGQVFKARHRRMDRIVAVKLLPSQTNKDPDVVARFEREVKTVAKISHPNIVAAYDADCANGRHFLVMEFVEGCDLSALVKSIGPFSIEQALNYILQSARGLEAAHAQGIIHRDIKPANLLLDKKGIVRVLDLGIARLADEVEVSQQPELTSTGVVLGTPAYMAPEQALDPKTADGRADIYALGCSLFYLLTGKSAYEGDTMLKKLVAHREQPIPSLRTIRRDIPDQVETLFRKMVAKNAEDRYQTMTEVIEALESCGRSLELKLNTPLPLGSPIDAFDMDRTPFLEEDGSSDPTIPIQRQKMSTPQLPQNYNKFFFIGSRFLSVLILLSVVVLNLRTKGGTLVITVNEPDAEVQVLDQSGKVEITRKGEKGPITISVDPGKHRLKISKEGFEFFTQEFSIESGGKQQLTAKLIPRADKPTVAVTTPVSEIPEKTPLAFKTLGFDEWMKNIAGLPAEEMVEAVFNKLQELNPGFDGKNRDWAEMENLPRIDNGVVTEIGFICDHVTDISPVRALTQLQSLWCSGSAGSKGQLSDLSPINGLPLIRLRCNRTQISDLSPLKGMLLNSLDCDFTQVSDLSPVKGMPLTHLSCFATQVADLSPLEGMQLKDLICSHTQVAVLSPIKGMPLERLEISRTNVSDISVVRGMTLTRLKFFGTRVADLSPLEGMKLKILDCRETQIADLSPLRGMPITKLNCALTPVCDLSPLDGMKLEEIVFTPTNITKGLDVIRQMTTIKTVGLDDRNQFPSDTFWKKYDLGEAVKQKETANPIAIDEKPIEDFTTIVQNAELKKPLAFETPEFDEWIKKVAALSTEQQLEAVSLKLVELNPGFDGKLSDISGDESPKVENGIVTALGFHSDKISDISPVRALSGLKDLSCYSKSRGGSLSDLSPLRGTSLRYVNLQNTNVTDLSPLRGMKLKFLNCLSTRVSNLSPLHGMKLTRLNCGSTNVSDLSPLQGMALLELYCHHTHVSDLSPLQGMPLLELYCHNTHVSDLTALRGIPLTLLTVSETDVDDLSPLQGMPLTVLVCHHTDVSDFSPLREMSLSTVNLTPRNVTRGMEIIRQMKSLRTIGADGGPAIRTGEFWKKYDAGEFGKPMPVKSTTDLNDPSFQQWIKDVAALPAELQAEAVSQKLVELNPGFDGKLTDISGTRTPKIENGVVTQVGFLVDNVTDISPVRAFAELTHLNCSRSRNGNSILSDLAPLKGMDLFYFVIQSRNVRDLTPLAGMPLNTLNCQHCSIKDLSPLRAMPLRNLILSETKVADLSPLNGMKLNYLYINGTRVKDVSVLKGMPLRLLRLDATRMSDLSPLQGMPLTNLACQFTQVFDLSPLKGLPLSSLNCSGSPVSDLSPLRGMELTEIYFSPDRIASGIDSIRQMKTIENIGIDTGSKLSPDEFWRKYDAGEFGKPAIPK